jgi:hypothetical protein
VGGGGEREERKYKVRSEFVLLPVVDIQHCCQEFQPQITRTWPEKRRLVAKVTVTPHVTVRVPLLFLVILGRYCVEIPPYACISACKGAFRFLTSCRLISVRTKDDFDSANVRSRDNRSRIL